MIDTGMRLSFIYLNYKSLSNNSEAYRVVRYSHLLSWREKEQNFAK